MYTYYVFFMDGMPFAVADTEIEMLKTAYSLKDGIKYTLLDELKRLSKLDIVPTERYKSFDKFIHNQPEIKILATTPMHPDFAEIDISEICDDPEITQECEDLSPESALLSGKRRLMKESIAQIPSKMAEYEKERNDFLINLLSLHSQKEE